MAVTIKSEQEIQLMRDAGKILAEVHERLAEIIAPGITTWDIDRKGEEMIREAGCIPSFKGYQADAAWTHGVGKVDPESQRLMDVTKESFFRGIEYARPGNHLYQVSAAIQRFVEKNGYSVVRALVGHGIGREMHEEPQIPNYKPMIRRGIRLRPGMTLAIEPMVNAGKYEVWMLEDDWTVVTRDGTRSAHYENTVLITEGDPEILSLL